jgi:hypothetical protein
MGVDVARFGDDRSIIGYRQGRDFRSRPWKAFRGLSTVQLANIAMAEADIHKPDAIVIESTGPGAGVIDIMRDRGYKIIECHPGARPSQDFDLFVNVRAWNWSRMRDWLYEVGCIPDHPELFKELTTILYGLDRHEQRIKMEAKEDMKKRGLPSPDIADMLSLTFFAQIARRDRTKTLRPNMNQNKAITEYNELSY